MLQANLYIQSYALEIYAPIGKSKVKEKVCTLSRVAQPLELFFSLHDHNMTRCTVSPSGGYTAFCHIALTVC